MSIQINVINYLKRDIGYIKKKFGSLRALFIQEADIYVLEQLKGTKEYLVNLKNNSV